VSVAICVWPLTGAVRYAVVASRGVWRSLVARFVRDEEVVGSNPATPTAKSRSESATVIATVAVFACGSRLGRPFAAVPGVRSDRLSGGLEDDSAPDLDGVVGEPLVVAAEEGHVDGGGHAMLPLPVHED
jgi:hypothetical protein